MSWLQVKLTTPATDAEYVAELLQQLGALSVTFSDAADQPIYEPGVNETPLWQTTDVLALFAAETDLAALVVDLRQRSDRPLPPLRADPLEDKDWVRAWMEHYQPMDFGHGLWICPSHLAPPDPHATNVLLDPGLAFGTGTHPTTAMCLRFLAAHPPRDQIVIDYGCGSGILALAAAKLGARHVYAIDNDPQALLATQRNAAQNAVTAQITVGAPGQLAIPKAQTILANILAGPLVALAPLFASLLNSGGNIVLSGILYNQSEMIQQAYRDTFTLATITRQDDWIALMGQRRP
jgi:ribosomal protein L11 methyltransferase